MRNQKTSGWIAGALAAGMVVAPAAALGDGGGDGWAVWLQASEDFRIRRASSPVKGEAEGGLLHAGVEGDQDLRFALDGGARDPSDRYGADLAMALWYDTDGTPGAGSPRVLGSLRDTENPWLDVYAASVEYRNSGLLSLVRAGRQTAVLGRPATFDGATVVLAPAPSSASRLEVFAFGGRTVHFFRAEPLAAGQGKDEGEAEPRVDDPDNDDPFEDWMAAGGISLRLLPNLRVTADYRFLREDTLLREGLTDHSYGGDVSFRLADTMMARLFARGLGPDLAMVGGQGRIESGRGDVGLALEVEAQTITLEEIAEEEDPYLAILGPSLPHLSWRAEVFRSFRGPMARYGVQGGWNGRVLTAHDEGGPFNRSYGRFYLQLLAEDVVVRGPFVNVVLEAHYTPRADTEVLPSWSDLTEDDGLLTAGGGVGYETDRLRVEAGTHYQRFRYDYYRDLKEVSNVRTLYGQLAYRPFRRIAVRARYDFEVFDREVHAFTLGLTQSY